MVAAIDPEMDEANCFFSPWRIRGMLRNWHALLDARPRHPDEPHIHIPSHDWSLAERIEQKAELSRALRWLRNQDIAAAEAIECYYIEGWDVGKVSEWTGLSERAVYYRIQRGIRRMAGKLGWKPAPEPPSEES
ncbi:RNA polymerase sigma factor [Nitrolancea hollandica]|uniref:Uncharacterized protein n=1 Tax=Nitrolancea hollandica Lb TaxID=1129897 RepID=I4EG21_9BACT|nr:sigma-70 family RNA polymerase sigma factor [Nitrolancea hollandica]CCF83633.1 conserved hypothetical protein [Nitrolancea hollandica Lb]